MDNFLGQKTARPEAGTGSYCSKRRRKYRNRVLPAGTELIPQETDKETYLDAETSDGTRCRIEVETEDGYTYMIHG